ncbi:ATP-binding protein [Vibrio sp. SA48]
MATLDANKLREYSLRIRFLTYQIETFVKQLDKDYTKFARYKTQQAIDESQKEQNQISDNINMIFLISVIAIIITISMGLYIYLILGNSLFSITQAMKKLAQGDRSAKVPQQNRNDEIGDLARSFHIFYKNVAKLEHTTQLLEEKSRLLERTFLAMRDGFAIFDNYNHLIACNEQFYNLLQTSPETLPPGTDFSLIATLLNQQQTHIYGTESVVEVQKLLETSTEQEPLELQCNDIIIEWRNSSLTDHGFACILIDRTKRKELELHLAQTQKMQAVGHLTGGIAHDFNNLLAVIIGNLELISKNTLPECETRRFNRALKAAESSALLTQRLLAYSRKQPLCPKPVDINNLIYSIKDLMGHSLPPSITIELQLSISLPPAMIDANQLETALMNLIVNAKDAIEEVGTINVVTTQLIVERKNRTEEMLQISIIDQGCGMDETTLQQVFEPFFTTKPTGKGSGLGLSMVYGFIRQSGGRIEIDSKKDMGLLYTCSCPSLSNEQPTT